MAGMLRSDVQGIAVARCTMAVVSSCGLMPLAACFSIRPDGKYALGEISKEVDGGLLSGMVVSS